MIVFKILSVTTNFFFTIPVALTLAKKLYVHSIFWLLAGGSSYCYHLCKITNNACFLPYYFLRMLDHIFASTVVVVIGIELFNFIRRIKWYWELFIMSIALTINAIFVYVLGNGVCIAEQFVLIVICLILMFVLMFKKSGDENNIKRDSYVHYVSSLFHENTRRSWYFWGITFIVLAYILFRIPQYISNIYFYIHPLWHTFGAFGASMVIVSTI